MMGRAIRTAGLLGLASMMLGLMAPPAMAAPPNDSESTAIEVSSIPFTYEQDTAEADANGPRFCSNNTSVFFTFTPSDTFRVQVDTFGSDYDTVLSVYTRSGGVDQVRCNDDRFGVASGARFQARAGTTYFIMIAECCGSGGSGSGGELTLHVGAASNEPVEATLEISPTGTYDPVGGSATISGTITCPTTAAAGLDGVLRQVRDGLYVARAYLYSSAMCEPGDPVAWSVEVDSETSYAFAAGDSRLTYSAYASDGWNWTELAYGEKVTVTLQTP